MTHLTTSTDTGQQQQLTDHPRIQQWLHKLAQRHTGAQLRNAIELAALSDNDLHLLLLVQHFHKAWSDAISPNGELASLLSQFQTAQLSLAYALKREPLDTEHLFFRVTSTLFEEMAHWYPADNKLLQKKHTHITSLVHNLHRLIDENSHTILTQLDKLLQEWLATQKKEQKKAHRIEQRLLESEAAQRAVTQAQVTIEILYQEHLAGSPLPSSVVEFIAEPLKHELRYLLINHGRGDPRYRLWEKLIKFLGWLFKSQKTIEQQRQLQLLLPEMMERLAEPLVFETCSQHDAELFVSELNHALFMTLQKVEIDCTTLPITAVDTIDAAPRVSLSRQSREQWSKIDLGDWFILQTDLGEIRVKLLFEDGERGSLLFTNCFGHKALEKSKEDFLLCLASGVATPLKAVNHASVLESASDQCEQLLTQLKADTAELALQQQRLRQAAEKARQEAEQLTQLAAHKHPSQTAHSVNLTQQQRQSITESLNTLKTGDWIELKSAEGEWQRGKLAVHLLSSDKYIFSNRFGEKMAELTKDELITAIATDQMKIHGGGSNFEDQLAKVVKSLRKT